MVAVTKAMTPDFTAVEKLRSLAFEALDYFASVVSCGDLDLDVSL